MTNLGDAFSRANDRCRQRAHQRWHHHQRKQQILRSQIGFGEIKPDHPIACTGCRYYHDQSDRWQQDQRQTGVCGLHPYGWQNSAICPDWATPAKELSERAIDASSMATLEATAPALTL
ncbi:MAG: hypothetical protein O2890_10740 [Cyanobacteria bacterium]|nr:hypothetical protein [Cyanobacteriota bacterium]